ncbi:MAG: hypothetical protein VKM17_12090, partial [Cyanobacteriota bacterium]|nr:hypothetical protein [Cyanobacteriota bacterium]
AIKGKCGGRGLNASGSCPGSQKTKNENFYHGESEILARSNNSCKPLAGGGTCLAVYRPSPVGA